MVLVTLLVARTAARGPLIVRQGQQRSGATD